MNTQPIDQTIDDIDYSDNDYIDPGDFVYCTACTEWVIPTEDTETNPDIHRIIIIKVCPGCGEILAEEV